MKMPGITDLPISSFLPAFARHVKDEFVNKIMYTFKNLERNRQHGSREKHCTWLT